MLLTFAEYILSESLDHDYSGWVSPTGNVHKFHVRDEHVNNHHPDIRKAVRAEMTRKRTPYDTGANLDAAMRRGYARIRKNGSDHIVHYDHNSKGGKEAALHGLAHMKPGHGNQITVTHTPWTKEYDPNDDQDFHKASAAAAHIRKIG